MVIGNAFARVVAYFREHKAATTMNTTIISYVSSNTDVQPCKQLICFISVDMAVKCQTQKHKKMTPENNAKQIVEDNGNVELVLV